MPVSAAHGGVPFGDPASVESGISSVPVGAAHDGRSFSSRRSGRAAVLSRGLQCQWVLRMTGAPFISFRLGLLASLPVRPAHLGHLPLDSSDLACSLHFQWVPRTTATSSAGIDVDMRN